MVTQFLVKSSLTSKLVYIFIGFMVRNVFFNHSNTQLVSQFVVSVVFPHFYFVESWFRTPASSGMCIFGTIVNNLLLSAVATKAPSKGLRWSWFCFWLCLLIYAELRLFIHGSSPLILGVDLKISDQNN